MPRILPPPERESFEREIKKLVSDDGDISSIAAYVQKDRSLVSKMLNPDSDEKHNPFYLFVIFLWAFDCLRDGLADDVLKIILRERDKWTHQRTRIFSNPAETTVNIGIQYCEFLQTELEGKPFDEQIKELVDIEEALSRKKTELINQRNARYCGD